jgi:hypothetical protein
MRCRCLGNNRWFCLAKWLRQTKETSVRAFVEYLAADLVNAVLK